MNYFFHPGALDEYLTQINYYESQQPGLGARFLATFDSALEKILGNPNGYKIIALPDVHEFILTEFPYSILYRLIKSELEILAVAAHRRRPNYWRKRL